jgi:23S rRNA (cytosine1962-C5)-methyltransferase
MNTYSKIILKPGKEIPVLRFHPWIFSGAVHSMSSQPKPGDVVECFTNQGKYLATGHFMNGSLTVKILTFEQQLIDNCFWENKINTAWTLRKALGYTSDKATTAYRLIHNEGDMMPGLIVDVYNDIAVIQAHTPGMHLARTAIAEAIVKVSDGKIASVYDKSAAAIRKMTGQIVEDGLLKGDRTHALILENGLSFHIDVVTGQKTGFFVDQRENRKLLGSYSKDRAVLNLFGYTGGFSVYAAASGAKVVHTVDSSAAAIELARKNIAANHLSETNHCICEDAKLYMQKMPTGDYDLIILDPPAYAKNVASRNQALKGYRSLNALALSKIAKGGILFTFSCSQVVDRQMFTSAVTAAAIDSGRKVQIIRQLTQPPDHPINIFHQEGEYLKGLVLLVE